MFQIEAAQFIPLSQKRFLDIHPRERPEQFRAICSGFDNQRFQPRQIQNDVQGLLQIILKNSKQSGTCQVVS